MLNALELLKRTHQNIVAAYEELHLEHERMKVELASVQNVPHQIGIHLERALDALGVDHTHLSWQEMAIVLADSIQQYSEETHE